MTDIISKQKQFLIDAISDAKKKEFQRLKRMQNVTSKSEIKTLTERFDKERQIDQNRIEHLSHDLSVVKEKMKSGDLQKVSEYRSGQPRSSRATDKEMPNRFEGIENHDQIIFHTDIVNKFNKHDRRFEIKQNHVKFDALAENRKLQLLDSKRTLLKQLISIQATEQGGGAQSSRNSGRNYAHSRGGSSCGSSVVTSSTGESWATFASRGSNHQMSNSRAPPSQQRSNVPRLALPRITES